MKEFDVVLPNLVVLIFFEYLYYGHLKKRVSKETNVDNNNPLCLTYLHK